MEAVVAGGRAPTSTTNMRANSTTALIFRTGITLVWVTLVAGLAFIWSLDQTIALTSQALMDPQWGFVMGLVIQLGPQVFLALSSVSSGNGRLGWLIAFWSFSVVDALTNIGALWEQYSLGGGGIEAIGWIPVVVGMFVAIAIVFAEEVLAYGLSILADNIANLIVEFGGTPPAWLFIASDAMSRVGTSQMLGGSHSRGSQRQRAG